MIDYENILSEKVKSIKFSGIRKFFDIAASMGNIISLSVGEPDFKTPFIIRKAAIRTLEKGKTAYTANAGMAELRQEIVGYLKERINVEYDPAHGLSTFRSALSSTTATRCLSPNRVLYATHRL